MYYKTLKSTKTGKKFEELVVKIQETSAEQKRLCTKYGFEQYRPHGFYAWGGFSSCIFKVAPNKKDWKNVFDSKDEWMPRLTSNVGKAIQKEFEAMPAVTRKELNSCIGFNQHFKSIGFDWCDTHFGFSVKEDWGVKVPSDCEEITKTEFNKLFN